jgi:hypothetical protein
VPGKELNEEAFNLEVRKFLKKVGITSQREIERAVREAMERGALSGTETLQAQMMLTIPVLNLSHRIEGEIVLG